MKCTYERTIFENAETGFVIASFRTGDMSVPEAARNRYRAGDSIIRFTATGYRLPTTDTLEIDVSGEWKNNKYGLQYEVVSFVEIMPQTKEGIIGYLSSGLIRGMGEKTAKIIVDQYGTGTLDMLDNNPEKLLEVKGISQKKYDMITASYNESKGMREIMTFLSPFGVTPRKAAKIQQEFGANTMSVLKTQPFELCALNGFGFKTVDSIARKVKCSPKDPLRIRGAIQYILDESTLNGHLYLTADKLSEKAYELLNDGFPNEVVAEREINSELYNMTAVMNLISENGNIYKPYYFTAEESTAENIAGLLMNKPEKTDITKVLAQAQTDLKLMLSPKQADAVTMCFANNISIITGGPGTGKTTVLKIILEVYRRVRGGSVLLTAPTGRASRRMAESTGNPYAMTLHSALGLIADDEDSDYMNSSDPLEDDFIIIDETSMIDMKLAYELFRRIGKKTKLLLVGDADQLPSVGADNVFRELIGCGLIPVTRLDMVFRQSHTSRIALNAHTINENKSNLLYGSDFEFVPCETAEEASDLICNLYMKEISESGADNVQILSPFRNKGAACVASLNGVIRELVNPASPSVSELKAGKKVFRLHDRVLQTKNKGEISNGDVGKVISVYNGEDNDSFIRIEFSDKRIAEYMAEDFDIIEHAYAMTIHKSQGSEYASVIIPVLNSFYIMLRRNLIYTAITRAKEKVILVGQKQALNWSIHKNDIDERNTMLAERIKNHHGIMRSTKEAEYAQFRFPSNEELQQMFLNM